MVEPEVSTLNKICNASVNFLVKFMSNKFGVSLTHAKEKKTISFVVECSTCRNVLKFMNVLID
ncbi:hypothetical protein WN51_02186 [Melipona quadrifasciata]|uniref:Uncharacterized protein n=1 Tax=Melipona quadrifasciata TaxID=166423 RepID=A0A0N0BDQ2_9HYME|nr:hypothetical protein WN51_02186 [Melipona quadrifasciata]